MDYKEPPLKCGGSFFVAKRFGPPLCEGGGACGAFMRAVRKKRFANLCGVINA